MEKFCEFCTQIRAVIFCKADSAYLCLSCDTKVHSANALSSRHLRSLLCDSCRLQPVSAQCLTHRTFLCDECDHNLHESCSPGQKREVSGYMGSPSAKDFAVLWGFNLDKRAAAEAQLCSTSAGPVASSFHFLGNSSRRTRGSSRISKRKSCLVKSGAESDVFSSSYLTKVSGEIGVKQHERSFILQQILELRNLQLAEVVDNGTSSSQLAATTNKFRNSYDHLQEHQGFGSDQMKVDPLVLPFSVSESSPQTSTAANGGLLGESFWHCKSPFHNSELWSQTMQDLGICEDICDDDLNIPDVDISFRNFEELFSGDQDPIREMLDEIDAPCSSMEKSSNSIAMETSFASSICGSHPNQLEEAKEPINQVYSPMQDPQVYIRPSDSTMSSSIPRHSADSIATEDPDSAVSPLCHSLELEGDHLNSRQKPISRKKTSRSFSAEKQIRCKGDVRRRVKSKVL